MNQYVCSIILPQTAIIKGRRPIVFGDGEQTRGFTYFANVVQVNLLAASSQDVVGYATNIGCGEQISLLAH